MLNTFRRLHEGVYRFARHGAPTGPNVTLVGGVHGNERIGVEVLDTLRLALLRAAPLTTANNLFPVLKQGSVTLVYGNPRAQRIGKRGSEPHADLNRCFPRDLLEASEGKDASSYEHGRAKELAPIFATSDLLVDLHSTNKPSPPFVRLSGFDKVPTQLLEVSGRLPTQMLLLDPKHLIGDGNVALTDEFVGVHGGMGICYESGLASDLSSEKIDSITRSLLQILHHDMEVIEFVDAEGRIRSSGNVQLDEEQNTTVRDAYEITQVFKLTSKGFQWADGVGEENFQRVLAGQPIGYVGSEPFAVSYDSHIVFPKVPALWKIDAYVGTGVEAIGLVDATCIDLILRLKLSTFDTPETSFSNCAFEWLSINHSSPTSTVRNLLAINVNHFELKAQTATIAAAINPASHVNRQNSSTTLISTSSQGQFDLSIPHQYHSALTFQFTVVMYRVADGERRVLPLDAPDSPTTTANLFVQPATSTASSDAAPTKPKPRSKTLDTQTTKSSRRLSEEDDVPDVALHADGCAVAVHQSVLQLRCPWLYKQLRQLRHAPERVQHDGFGLELKLLDEQELQALRDERMPSCSKCPLQDIQALRLDYVRCAVHRCRGGQNKVDARAQEDSPVVVQRRKRLRYGSTDENQPSSGQLSVPKRARSLFGEVDMLNHPGVLHVKVEGAEIGEIVAVVEYIYRYKVRLLDERKAMRAVKLGKRLSMRSTMIYYFLCVAIRHVTTKTWMDMLVVASTLDEAVMRRLLCKSLLAFIKALKPEQYYDVLVDMNCYRISRLKHRDILIRAVVGLINGVRLLEFWRNLLNGMNRWICDQFKTMEQPPSLRVMHHHFAPEWKPYMERKPVNLEVRPGKGNLFTLLQFGKFQLQVRIAITDEMPILWRIIRSSSPQLLTTDPDELEDPAAFDADPHFWIRAQLKVKYWRAQPDRAEVRHEIFLEYQHCREQYSEWFELVPPSPESLAPAITTPAIQPECPGKAQFRGKFFVWGDPVCSLYHFLLHTTLFYSAPVGAPTEFSDLVVVSEMQRLPVETLVLVLRSDRLRVPEGERTLLRCLNILVFGKDFDRFESLSQKERYKYNGHAKDVIRLYKCVRWCFVPIDDIIITLRRSPRELKFYELIEKGLQDTFRRFLRRRPWGWRKYRHAYMKNETNVVEFRIEAGDNELSPDDFPPLPKPEPSSQSSLILSPEAIFSDPPRVKSMS